jgi:hypothetical protein
MGKIAEIANWETDWPFLKMKAACGTSIAVIVLVFSGARIEGKAVGTTCTQPPYRVWWNVNGKNFTNLDVSECVACPTKHHPLTHSTPLTVTACPFDVTRMQCSLMSLRRHDLVTLSKIFVQRLSHTLPATPKNCTYLGWCGCVHH